MIPIPLSVFGWDAEYQRIIVKIDPQVILMAPIFDRDNFPQTFVPDWDVDYRAYWKDYTVDSP